MFLSTVQSQTEAREIVKLCPKCALLLFEFWSGRDFRKLPNGLWGYWIIFLTRTPVSCPVSLRYGWKKWFLILTFLLPWVMCKILSWSFWSPGQKDRNVLIQELDPTLITFLELPETDKYKMWDMTFSQPAQIVFFDQTCKSEIFIYMTVDFDPSCDMPLLSHQTPISCSNLMSPCSSSIVLLEGWHPPPKTLKVGGC